jgi:hypothetical protein
MATCSVLGLLASPAMAQTITNPAPVNGTFTIPFGTGSVLVTQGNFTGTIVNPELPPFPPVGSSLATTNTAIAVRSKTFTGSVVNLGSITADTLLNGLTPAAMARPNAIGIGIGPTLSGGTGGTFIGGVTNSGFIEAIGEANHNLD